MRDERTKLEPRWLYLCVGTFVVAALVLIGVTLVAVGQFLHGVDEAMAGF